MYKTNKQRFGYLGQFATKMADSGRFLNQGTALLTNRRLGVTFKQNVQAEAFTMKNTTYLDPNFYILSEKMNYTIRGEVDLGEAVDGDILQRAFDTAIKRFPYFSVRVVRQGEELVIEDNPLPHIILNTDDRITIGSKEVNYHIVVLSYFENKIFFNLSHCITDGAGRAPLTKSVLYYYLKEKHPEAEFDHEGIYLADDQLFPDEDGSPLPEEEIMKAAPTYYRPVGEAFHLSEGHYIKDDHQMEFRFRVDEKQFMALNKSNDASPSVLASAFLTKTTWKLHPENKKNIVTGIGFNMRPGLDNKHSHLPLVTTINLICPDKMRDFDLLELCTCLRGMVILQSQEENVRYIYKTVIECFNTVKSIPTLEGKRELFAKALSPEFGPTFFVSYVGKSEMGCLAPYIKAMYTTVDADPEGSIVIEITSADGYFYFTFMQGFSTDIYFREFMNQIEEHGVPVEYLGCGPILAAKIQLPE